LTTTELPGRRVEAPNVAAPERIGATHDDEAFVLKRTIEQPRSREEAQHEWSFGFVQR
jgi:hypothetical protein